MGLIEQFIILKKFADDLGDLKRKIAAEDCPEAESELWIAYDKLVDRQADHLIAMNRDAGLGAALRVIATAEVAVNGLARHVG